MSLKSLRIISLLVVAELASAQYVINSGSVPPPSGSEPWRGILDYTRAIDWRNAGVKIPPNTSGVLGIPAYTYGCGTVVPTGLKNWQANYTYAPGAQIADSRGNIEFTAQGGTSGATEPLNGSPNAANSWPIANGTPFTETGTNLTWVMTTGDQPPGTDTAQITNAIIHCAATVKAQSLPGGIVTLAAGDFYLTAGLTFNGGVVYPQTASTGFPTLNQPISGVVLRGQGPMQTTLHVTDEGQCSSDICVVSYPASFTNYAAGGSVGASVNPGAAAQWLGSGQFQGTYSKGDTQLIVGPWYPSAPGTAEPTVGDVLFLDQNNDAVSICPDPVTTVPGNCQQAGIAGATATGTTATIVTSVAHGFSVDQCVGIGDVGGTDVHSNTQLIGFNTGMNPDKTNNCGLRPGIDNGVDEPPHLPGWWQITNVGCIQSGSFVDVSQCGNAVINAFQFNAGRDATGCPPAPPPATGLTNCLGHSGGGQVTADTGGVMLSSVNGVTMTCCSNATQNARLCPPGPNSPNPSCLISQGEISIRSQFEVKAITAVVPPGTGTCPPAPVHVCYTIDPPLYMNNWRASQRPGVWWTGHKNTGIGLEGFTYLTEHDYGNGHVGGIQFVNSYNCWVRNVRALQINRNLVWSDRSGRIEAVDNYIGGTRGGASTAYVFEAYSTADDLMMNNICEHTVSCFMTSTVMGRVTAYNYMVDSAYVLSYDWLLPLMTMNHLAGFMNLFEGNDSAGIHTDNLHGTAGVSTVFRQRSRGQDLPWKMFNRNGLSSWSFNRGLNFVGSIFGWGWQQVQTKYLDNTLATAAASLDQAIFGFGKWKQNITAFGNDQLATSSSLRWGNYDAVTQTVRWCGTGTEATCTCGAAGVGTYCPAPGTQNSAEIPTQGSLFLSPNAIPASQTLPPSFFLSSQPYFWVTNWGTPGWPAIGPDVNAGGSPLDTTCPGGITVNPGTGAGSFYACDGEGAHHAYQIPAQICFNHLPIDTTWKDAKIGGPGQETFPITSAAFTSNANPANSIVTLTVNHDLNLAQGPNITAMTYTIQVTGVNPPAFNGTFQVHNTQSSPTTLVYNLPSCPGCTTGTGGQVTTPNFKQYDAHMCYPNLPY